MSIEIELPENFSDFRLPDGVQARLAALLDRQDTGNALSEEERSEAEGLVNLAELLTLIKLRSKRVSA